MRIFQRLVGCSIDAKVIQNVQLQVAGCAHQERFVAFAMKDVRARRLRQAFDEGRIKRSRQDWARQQALDRVADSIFGMLAMDHLP